MAKVYLSPSSQHENPYAYGGTNEAAFHNDLGAQSGKALDVLVNGTETAEIAAAGHGHFRPAETAQQGAHQVIGGPDLPRGILLGAGGVDLPAVDLHGVGIDAADMGPQLLQNFQAQRHIGDLGNVFNAAHAVHHQGGGNNGNSGIFGTADLYFTKQGRSTLYNIFCQVRYPLFKAHSSVAAELSQKQFARPVPLHTRGKAAGLGK